MTTIKEFLNDKFIRDCINNGQLEKMYEAAIKRLTFTDIVKLLDKMNSIDIIDPTHLFYIHSDASNPNINYKTVLGAFKYIESKLIEAHNRNEFTEANFLDYWGDLFIKNDVAGTLSDGDLMSMLDRDKNYKSFFVRFEDNDGDPWYTDFVCFDTNITENELYEEMNKNYLDLASYCGRTPVTKRTKHDKYFVKCINCREKK